MPIKPENRARYPKDWPALSLAARERASEPKRSEGSLERSGWTADQQLQILCETLRNITNGTTHLHEGNYDHAALDLEVAAGKLRLLERCRQSNADVSDRRDNL